MNRLLIQSLEKLTPNHTLIFRDMYEEIPDFFIDVEKEQKQLQESDFILLQHPLYWYSCPPLMKLWIDLVFLQGWAYGPNGDKLQGKVWRQIISTGGQKDSYQPQGFHGHLLSDFLLPFRRTAELCQMRYLEPFVIHGAHALNQESIPEVVSSYLQLLVSPGESQL